MRIIDYLNQLPEPYCTQAQQNHIHRYGDTTRLQRYGDYMSTAINVSFSWSNTPQGHEYWQEIYDKYRRIESGAEVDESHTKREEDRRAKIVTFSSSMSQMLDEIGEHNSVARAMRYYSDNSLFCNYVTMRGDMCSYLPNGREHMVNDEGKWRREGRQDMKPGKLARKILNDSLSITDKEFEEFSNMVKSYIGINGDEDGEGRNLSVDVVSGEDIRKYYHEDSYSQLADSSSNLWGSCMRYASCQDYFDIFVDNNISMLVAKDTVGKVVGRALLWSCTNDRKAMDTIYAPERIRPVFTKWAIDNDYFYKSQQSCHHHEFDMYNGVSCSTWEANVQLRFSMYDEYPYMDTMMYLNDNNKIMSNRDDDYTKTLRDTGGGYDEGGVHDDYNDDTISEDDSVYLSYNTDDVNWEGTTHINNTVMTRDGYRVLDRDATYVSGNWYVEGSDSIVYVDSRGEWYHVEDTTETYDGDTIHEDDAMECAHDGNTYHENDMTKHDGVWVHNDNMESYLEQLNQEENA